VQFTNGVNNNNINDNNNNILSTENSTCFSVLTKRFKVFLQFCYRWSWFETRSEILSAERQAKLHSKVYGII